MFRERYAKRSGIESTNSGLKNRLGLGWLNVRGKGAVFRTLLLKVSGWNVMRAATSAKLRAAIRAEIAKLLGTGWSGPFGQSHLAILTHLCRFQQPHRPQKSHGTTITRRLADSQRQTRFVV